MDAQAALGLRWPHRTFCWFCSAPAQMFLLLLFLETMVLTHPEDVEAAKIAKLILTGLLGAALFSLFRLE